MALYARSPLYVRKWGQGVDLRVPFGGTSVAPTPLPIESITPFEQSSWPVPGRTGLIRPFAQSYSSPQTLVGVEVTPPSTDLVPVYDYPLPPRVAAIGDYQRAQSIALALS